MRTLHVIPAAAIALAGLAACRPAPDSRPAPASAQAQPPAAQSISQAAPAAAEGNGFTGAIAETMDSGGYTYLRLRSAGKDDVWVAAPQFDAKVGETISVSLDMAMQDFQSKTLDRTFPLIYFVQEVGRNGQAVSAGGQAAAPPMMSSHGAGAAPATVEKMEPPAGGLSVADVFARKAALSGKPVTGR